MLDADVSLERLDLGPSFFSATGSPTVSQWRLRARAAAGA
jgi:hypothetical protein